MMARPHGRFGASRRRLETFSEVVASGAKQSFVQFEPAFLGAYENAHDLGA